MSRELDAKVAEKVFGWEIFRAGYEGTEDETPEQKKYQSELERGSFSGVGWYAYLPISKEVVAWGNDWQEFYRFTTEASMDYVVLRHVRETWDFQWQSEFDEAVENIILQRADRIGFPFHRMMYEPGDYSRAALMALGEISG